MPEIDVRLFEGARKIMAHYGFQFHAPWDGDLDDLERESYKALRDVIAFIRDQVLAHNARNGT